jgi:hypothetical protein
MRLLLLASLAVATFAQAHRIEMTFTGVGCEPCIQSMPNRAQRIRGVESASVDAEKGILKVTLAAQNRVRIEQIRDLIQQDGTKAASAIVEISGTLEQAEGAWHLKVPQWPVPLALAGLPAGAKAGDTIRIEGRIANLTNPPKFTLEVQKLR